MEKFVKERDVGERDMKIERISAVTLKVSDMARSVHFYEEILGLEVLYGGKGACFSSLRIEGVKDVILNLQQGPFGNGLGGNDWGRIIFHVKDVDEFWSYLKKKEFNPASPRDAEWGERYFHLHDPDGHELSFAQPLD